MSRESCRNCGQKRVSFLEAARLASSRPDSSVMQNVATTKYKPGSHGYGKGKGQPRKVGKGDGANKSNGQEDWTIAPVKPDLDFAKEVALMEPSQQPNREQTRVKLASLERARQEMVSSDSDGVALNLITTEVARLKGALIATKEPERRIADVAGYIEKQTVKVGAIRSQISSLTKEAINIAKDIAANRQYLRWAKWQAGQYQDDGSSPVRQPHQDQHTLEAMLADIKRTADHLAECERHGSSWPSQWSYTSWGEDQHHKQYQAQGFHVTSNGTIGPGIQQQQQQQPEQPTGSPAVAKENVDFWQDFGRQEQADAAWKGHWDEWDPDLDVQNQRVAMDGYEATATGMNVDAQQSTPGQQEDAATGTSHARLPFRRPAARATASHRGQGSQPDEQIPDNKFVEATGQRSRSPITRDSEY